MGTFIELQLKTGGIIAISVLLYALFLAKDSFFQRNRIWLLATLSVPWMVPLLAMPLWLKSLLYAPQNEVPIRVLTFDNIPVNVVTAPAEKGIDWMLVGLTMYALVCSILFIRLLWGYIFIHRLKSKGQHSTYKGYNVVLLNDGTINPFSFFRTIFIPNHLERKENGNMILEHERRHCAQLHSIDISLAEWLLIVQWWNPFVWWLRQLIAQNHEYCVDNAMVQHTEEPKEYQYSLLNLWQGSKHVQLVNNFNQSLTKKRLVMMNKKHTNNIIGWTKGLLVLPLLLATLLAFTNPDKTIVEAVETSSINNEQDLRKHFATCIKYPIEARDAGVEGTITVNFKVDKKGKVGKVNIGSNVDAIQLDNVVVVAYAPSGQQAKSTSSTKKEMLSQLELEVKRVVEAMPVVKAKDMKDQLLQIDFEFLLQTKKSAQKEGLSETWEGNTTTVENSKGEVFKLIVRNGRIDMQGPNDNKPTFILDSKEVSLSEIEELDLNEVKAIGQFPAGQFNPFTQTTVKNGAFVIHSRGFIVSELANRKLMDKSSEPIVFVDGREFEGDLKDLSPDNIAKMNVLKDSAATDKYGDKAKDGAIEITTKGAQKEEETVNSSSIENTAAPMFIVDGMELNEQQFEALFPMKYHSETRLRGQAAVDKYGEKARNGVIVINAKGSDGQLGMKNMALGRPMNMSPTNVFTANVSGKNTPLFIVDGEKRAVNDVNSEDIDVVTVLKDPEVTQLYGEGAENGVVLVTTKNTDEKILYRATDDTQVSISDFSVTNGKGESPLFIVDGIKQKTTKIDAEDIKSVNVMKGEKAIEKYGEDAKDGVIIINSKDYSAQYGDVSIVADKLEITSESVEKVRFKGESKDGKPYVLLDGEEFDGDLKDLNPEKIGSMTVLKDTAAKALYGDKAEHGVIVITSKIE